MPITFEDVRGEIAPSNREAPAAAARGEPREGSLKFAERLRREHQRERLRRNRLTDR